LSEDALGKLGKFSRYLDLDGDAIPYRTLPGNKHFAAAYFARGSGHNEHGEYSERPDDFHELMDRLARKFENARSAVPAPVIERKAGAKIGIIAYGTTHHAIRECQHQLRTEHGFDSSYMRIRALPFSRETEAFLAEHDRLYVVEQNRDGQMHSLLSLDFPAYVGKLRTVLHYNGMPIDARFVTNAIAEKEKESE